MVNRSVTPLTWTFVVELIGLEPTTSCMPCKRSSKLSYSPVDGFRHGAGTSPR
jgi:hypothetical protein